jgi:hypothetical protein
VQGELLLLALIVAAVPALVAVLLVSLALISLDGHAGVQTLAVSFAAALGMVAAGSATCTGLIVLSRGLARGSRPAWAVTLAGAVLLAVLAGFAQAWLAPQLSLPSLSAVVAASPAALAAVLLLTPATLRSVSGAPRRAPSRPVAQERPRAAA